MSPAVIRFRLVCAALTGVSLMSLAACGGADSPAAAPAPVAPAATSDAPAPSAAAPGGGSAAGDKKLCEAAGKADKAMRGELVKVVQSGKFDTASMQRILGGLADEMTAAAGEGDSKVATTMRQFAAQANEAAKAADPATAADNPAFEKTGKDLTAACKAAGVTLSFS